MKKRTIICLTMLLILSMTLSACASGGSKSPSPSGGTPSGGSAPENAPELKAGAVLGVGGLGDQSFNDLVYAGLERAKSELGVEFDYAEPKQASDFELFLREMAVDGEYAVIIAIGFEQQDALTTVAAEFPEQKFGFIDGVVEAPNIVSYTTSEEQASFLVGALAGLMKADAASYGLGDTQEIGFVGALDIPLINKFRAGYEAGARYVNPDISVRGDYVGSFDDITTAKEIANTMNANGADIVYHAAGGAGLGVFQSATEKGGLAIGCNSNQNYIDPDHIMASMLKRVDVITFDIIQSAFTDGAFQGGATVEVGLSDEGVGYTCEQSNIAVSQEIIDQVEALKDEIIKGTLTIPTEKDAVDAFLAENQ
nr:BMP family ABC transporter substrate-binding protein [uncultured Oscillibacter sp.]